MALVALAATLHGCTRSALGGCCGSSPRLPRTGPSLATATALQPPVVDSGEGRGSAAPPPFRIIPALIAQLNFVTPGTATGGSGSCMSQESFSGIVSSLLFIAI